MKRDREGMEIHTEESGGGALVWIHEGGVGVLGVAD